MMFCFFFFKQKTSYEMRISDLEFRRVLFRSVDEATGDSFTNIRGQTSVRNSDPNVAVVIDGVQLSSLKQFNQDLFNIQQIEVLKGPQSAIYGRNAAAGAIVVTTKLPREELGGSVLASYGSWNTADRKSKERPVGKQCVDKC